MCYKIIIYSTIIFFLSINSNAMQIDGLFSMGGEEYNTSFYNYYADFDPLEAINRKVYNVNTAIINKILHIRAKAPVTENKSSFISNIIKNFFINLQQPSVVASALLKGNLSEAMDSAWRFIINSTVGLGGIADIATDFDIPLSCKSLGVVMVEDYKINKGIYFMLPILGSYSLRELITDTVEFFVNPLNYFIPFYSSIAILTMQKGYESWQYIDYGKLLLDNSVDSYVQARNFYVQNSNKACN